MLCCRVLFVCAASAGFFVCYANETPVFKSVPTTVKTSEHDTVLLPCYVENLGENSVRWWKEDTVLWDTKKPSTVRLAPNMRVFANQTLEVADVRASDTAEYTCQVVRPEPWNPINQIHAIEVLFPPSIRTIPESGEIEVDLGQEVMMGCVASGVPQPIVSWSYKGEEIPLINNRATLRFKATDKSKGGTYQCTASNGVGDRAAATIHLKIHYPPEVGAERLWVHTSPGERAELSCSVFSDPEAKVEWFQDGRPVEIGGRILTHRIGERHILIIRRVSTSDLGFFMCRAKNYLGGSQQSMQLSGIAKTANFKKGPRQSSPNNYTLIWEVESYSPIIEYSLMFRKHQPEEDPRGNAADHCLTAGFIINLHNCIQSLYTTPEDWSKLIIPAAYSPGPIHSQSYSITGLSPSSVYEASVVSRNKFGWSKPSHIFRFATQGAEVSNSTQTEPSLVTNTHEPPQPPRVIVQNNKQLSKEVLEQEEKEAAAEEEEKRRLKEVDNKLDGVIDDSDLIPPEYQGLDDNSADMTRNHTPVICTITAFLISWYTYVL